MESNIRVKSILSAAVSHSCRIKGLFCWMKVGWNWEEDASLSFSDVMDELQAYICNLVLLFSYLQECQGTKHRTKVRARCQEHYRDPASVWCSCRALKLAGNFAAPAVTVGWEYWKSSYLDLLLQRMWGGVTACEWDLHGFAMTLCMFTADVEECLIKNLWEGIRKPAFQSGQIFSLM